jgi:hypothetical protein
MNNTRISIIPIPLLLKQIKILIIELLLTFYYPKRKETSKRVTKVEAEPVLLISFIITNINSHFTF